MAKEAVVHIYSGGYYSAIKRSEFEFIEMRWMNLEPVIEGSKSESGEGNGNSLRYSCLENPMDGGAWWAAVHGVAKSQTQLNDFTFHFHALEKEMAQGRGSLVGCCLWGHTES